MAISKWPKDERPREKLLQRGAKSLSDAELLALFIHTGTRGKTAVDIGREMLSHFGDLRAILTADHKSFLSYPGLGPAKYALFQGVLEIGKRFMEEKLKRQGKLNNVDDVGQFLLHHLRDQPREIFAIIYLDTQHQIIQYEELFYGTLNGASVHPREVVKSALKHNAAAVIIAHNHPSGIAEPSTSDETISTKLKHALQLVEISLLDHIIVGDGSYYSMARYGLMR